MSSISKKYSSSPDFVGGILPNHRNRFDVTPVFFNVAFEIQAQFITAEI